MFIVVIEFVELDLIRQPDSQRHRPTMGRAMGNANGPCFDDESLSDQIFGSGHCTAKRYWCARGSEICFRRTCNCLSACGLWALAGMACFFAIATGVMTGAMPMALDAHDRAIPEWTSHEREEQHCLADVFTNGQSYPRWFEASFA